MRTSFSIALATSLLGMVALSACSGTAQPKFQMEMFDTGASPFARSFNASTTDTCEAARRALLSQGYLTTLPRPDAVDGTKNFQPSGDTHISVDFHVVCTPGEETSDTSIIYVNAVQNGYALKKSDTSASVGLSVLGSLSLPIRSNNDAMVKVSSETIPSGTFYDQFFGLVDHYLHTVVRTMPVSSGGVVTTPLPVSHPMAVPVPAPAAAPVHTPALEPAPPGMPRPVPVAVTVPSGVPAAPAAQTAPLAPLAVPDPSSASAAAPAAMASTPVQKKDTTPAVPAAAASATAGAATLMSGAASPGAAASSTAAAGSGDAASRPAAPATETAALNVPPLIPVWSAAPAATASSAPAASAASAQPASAPAAGQ
jgi:hypothetical protein